jgi:hypothetical protein
LTDQLGYLLRDKNPQTIQEDQEVATRIEDNILSSKVEPFLAPRLRMDIKPKIFHNFEPTSYISSILAKLQLTIDGIVKNQELMMNNIVKLERT